MIIQRSCWLSVFCIYRISPRFACEMVCGTQKNALFGDFFIQFCTQLTNISLASQSQVNTICKHNFRCSIVSGKLKLSNWANKWVSVREFTRKKKTHTQTETKRCIEWKAHDKKFTLGFCYFIVHRCVAICIYVCFFLVFPFGWKFSNQKWWRETTMKWQSEYHLRKMCAAVRIAHEYAKPQCI